MKEKLEKRFWKRSGDFLENIAERYFLELKCKITVYSVLERRKCAALDGIFLKWFV